MERKDFLAGLGIYAAACAINPSSLFAADDKESAFSKKLKPVGRAMEMEGQYVWCSSPIYGPGNKVHLFFSHWDSKKGMGGWINACRISHAVADSPEQPFTMIGTVLEPRAGFWDSTTCHNPFITKIDGKYCLYYMGNSNGKTNTKLVGLATSHSLYGPWLRPDQPLLKAGDAGAWDDHCTTNPAVIKHPNGQYWMYYKSWNTHDYDTETGPIRGNRKYGLAIAEKLTGPYIKYPGNPVIDFSGRGNNTQLEDAFVWMEGKKFKMIARDMGVFEGDKGIIMESNDGIHWGEPEIAFHRTNHYFEQAPAPAHLKKYGRFERPQILMKNNKPAYLFTTSQGGKFMTSSTFIFKIS